MGEGRAGELASAVRAELVGSGRTLGCAESCTGGLVAGALTSVSGSSEYFKGGVVSYWPSVKEDVLGVPAEVIGRFGVVSRECAVAMAEGARRVMGCDFSVSTTGIAGPGGAEPGKPVGTVWIAVAGPDGSTAELLHADGDRSAVRRAATERALELLLEMLR